MGGESMETPVEIQEDIQKKTKFNLVEWISGLLKKGRVTGIPSKTLKTVIGTEQDPNYRKYVDSKKV